MRRVNELRNVLLELYFEGALQQLVNELVGSETASIHLKFGDIFKEKALARLELVSFDGDNILVEFDYDQYCFEALEDKMVGISKSVHVVSSFEETMKRRGIDRWIKVVLTDESDTLLGSPHKISKVVTYGNGTLDSQCILMENHIIDLSRWRFESNHELRTWFKLLSNEVSTSN